MSRLSRAVSVLTVLVMVVLLSSVASAQSTISGQARDTSGAVMPGVRVEAASPVLIEGSRTATTSAEGRYTIVDVRPGTYTISFTIAGFTALKQQVEVRSNVTVPVDAEMKTGSVDQTVNVDATLLTVDVQNVAHPETLSRSDMDSVPTARNLQSVGSYIPGVHLNIPDVGGSQQIQQVYMSAHGNPPQHDVIMLDSMLINATHTDGQTQTYVANEMLQVATYSTIGNPANSSAGGVFVNMVPKDGGNILHGEFFAAYIPSGFVGTSLDSNLNARGIAAQSKITQIQDFDGSLGGPIRKDKLWFLLSGRKQLTYQESPICKNTDGSPCVDQSFMYSPHLRLTYQLNSKNKFSAMWMRIFKTAKGEVVTQTANGVAANIGASTQRTPAMFYVTQEKWTGILSPRLLVDVGFSLNKEHFNVQYQDGQSKVPFSPEWYSNVLLQDTVQNRRYNVGIVQNTLSPDRYVLQGGVAYVTGPHQLRFGIQDSWGPAYQSTIMNGDLYAVEANGVPTSVTVFDTPINSKPYLKADLGIYAMDTWTVKRLTVTLGIRWEYLSNMIKPQSAPAGRFVPARNFEAITCDTYKGISCFKNWAPRLGLAYDLFGSHKTVLKAGMGKYHTPLVQGNLNAFNPMFLTNQSRAWINTGGCTGPACFPTDAQIGPAPSAGFGTLTPRSLDPSYNREYNMQYTVGVQHEIRLGLTLNFNWVRRDDHQQAMTLNHAVPSSAWTPFTITNPLDGTPITIYNLDPSYVGLTPQLYQTNAPRSLRTNSYNGFETSVQGRTSRGAFIFAGWTVDRELSRQCDATIGTNSLNDPNSLRFCDWYGTMHQELGSVGSIPYRNEFKLQGNLPLWYKFEFSTSLYSSPVYNTNFALNNMVTTFPAGVNPEPLFAGSQQGFKVVNWTLTSTTKYPANCNCPTPSAVVDPGLAQGAETVLLVAPGSRLTPQLTQFDIAIRREFVIQDRHRIKLEAQVFNVLNSNVVTAEAQTLGSSVTPFVNGGIGGVPTAILNPRMLRLAVHYGF